MSYTYASFKTALATELSVPESDADFVAMLPTFIDDAEQRCYRELDLLSTIVVLTGNLTANNRYYTIPTGSGHVLSVNSVNVFDASSNRNALVATSREVIDVLWPTDTASGASVIPVLFARPDDTRIMVGPPPGSTFSIEIMATIRPSSLSISNTTTYLTLYLSDVFFAAAMVSASGFMRAFGSQSDDPQMAQSWESQFQARMASARSEELKKKYSSFASVMPGRSK